jgi:hypothetical protein
MGHVELSRGEMQRVRQEVGKVDVKKTFFIALPPHI